MCRPNCDVKVHCWTVHWMEFVTTHKLLWLWESIWQRGDRHDHTQFIQRTTLQSCAWKTADRYIPSEGRCQTRLLTLVLPLSFDDWLDYGDLYYYYYHVCMNMLCLVTCDSLHTFLLINSIQFEFASVLVFLHALVFLFKFAWSVCNFVIWAIQQ